MGKPIPIPDNVSLETRALFDKLNEYISFAWGEDVGEAYSPDMEKPSLIINIDNRTTQVLEDIGESRDAGAIPVLLYMIKSSTHDSHLPRNYFTNWNEMARNSGFEDIIIVDGSSTPLWCELHKSIGKTIEVIVNSPDMDKEKLTQQYPDLVLYGFHK